MAKEPGLEMKGQESGEIFKIPWQEVIHKHVRASDNVDIGDVDKVGNEFIVVREGVVSMHDTIFQNSTSITMMEARYGSTYPVAWLVPKFERKTEPTQQEIDMIVKGS